MKHTRPLPTSAALIAALTTPAGADPGTAARPAPDLSREPTLYCVGYAHLDTQWRWDFPTTIDRYIRDTLDQNFALFDDPECDGYTFNFTGSVRYEMMKEYYPEHYERLRREIAAGRWFVSGSSVDEGDANVPSPESVIRHVLYGNRYFKREFGKESVDFMLPDCFGFPASMPSIWAHCGLKGFSTQKLSWGSAVGIPFKIGHWEGPDGRSIIAALDPGPYVGAIKGPVHSNPEWVKRIETNGERYGVFADYHYYGVGDQGGAPHKADVLNYLRSARDPGATPRVILAASDQFYMDLTPEQATALPRYKGDLLLTEHSAGTLTSQSYMKRWMRMSENLADAAERAAVWDWHLNTADYPREMIERLWVRALANQMHDILPGTSIPRAYTYSWNDLILAMNGFAAVMQRGVEGVASVLDTTCDAEQVPVVVFNPLAFARQDVIELSLHLPQGPTHSPAMFAPDGSPVLTQVVPLTAPDPRGTRLLVLAAAPPTGASVFTGARSGQPDADTTLRVSERSLENEFLKVTLNDAGDVASIIDKSNAGREVLAAPAQLVFTHENPRQYPAWNMDWADRKNPPIGAVDGTPTFRIVERGPVRVALEVSREARGSIFTQTIRLSAGDAGRCVEVDCDIDWQSTECALKASFPLTVSNPVATYNWGLGTIERGNNEPTKYEVPSHEWFDLTDIKGDFGVSILENSKYGSDKPSDTELRLTLLYTPGVRGSFLDQHSQDWGRHQITYAIYPHKGDWREARTEQRARRLNQPLTAFQTTAHPGGARSMSLLNVSTPQVDVRALKLAEDSARAVIRVQELWGRHAKDVAITFGAGIDSAEELDGQERPIGPAAVKDGRLVFDLSPYSPRTFAVTPLPPSDRPRMSTRSDIVTLQYDTDVLSSDSDRADGAMDEQGRTYPGELFRGVIRTESARFQTGPADKGLNNAVTCRGQTIPLSPGPNATRLQLLVAATEDTTGVFTVKHTQGIVGTECEVPAWTGFIGQWDNRVWDREFEEVDFRCEGHVTAITPGYIKRAPVAWFATHRHHPTRGNEAYRFSYLYKLQVPLPGGTTGLVLPDNPKIRVFSVTITSSDPPMTTPAAPLYDDFTGRKPVEFRFRYPPPPRPVFEGATPTGRVRTERAESFAALTLARPSEADYADAASGNNARFYAFQDGERYAPHPGSGMTPESPGALPRLNDAQVARNDDDTRRCVWYDTEGRFYADLRRRVRLRGVNTFSWHVSNRAPQFFSVWASDADLMPRADITAGDTGGWTLLGVVDSRDLGQGGVHASRIALGTDQPLATCRWLLFIAQDTGQGTFFTEIDVEADSAP